MHSSSSSSSSSSLFAFSSSSSSFNFSLLAPKRWLLLLLLALLCLSFPSQNNLLVNANRTHHHQHQHRGGHNGHGHSQTTVESNEIGPEISPTESSAAQIEIESVAALPADASANEAAASTENQQTGKELFREYLSRGMLTCTEKYVGMLQKLNKLIATAHAEFTQCQRMADKMDASGKSAEKSRELANQLDMISELFEE